MKIYIAHSSSFDFQNDLYTPLRQSPIFGAHTFIFPHDGVQINSKEVLSECDFVIADVTRASTGMGIELGWANDLGKTIVCIHQEDSIPSSSLRFVSQKFFSYGHPDEISELVGKIVGFGTRPLF